MIVATAGHVDHGKTSLIRLLTGTDTDRLAEEKRRGLSIELGFAYLPREGATHVGFIDVPGHQRFINTMIAGIGAIDLALLVVAADDGPMPQTREHLDILQLLGVRRLLVAVTKTDCVEPGRLQAVQSDIARLLKDYPWSDVRQFPVSNTSGEGLAPLREYLLKQSSTAPSVPEDGYFYLSIDRSFTLKGIGLVVTGTAATGSVAVGDELRLQPAGLAVRVRGLHVHDVVADRAYAGQRVALNLTGDIGAEDIQRGDWLLAPQLGTPHSRIEAHVRLLPDAPFALKPYAPVKVYLGARRVGARLVSLSEPHASARLAPGDEAYVCLLLDQPVCSFRGQPMVLRDHAEAELVGGGIVLNPAADRDGSRDWRRQRLAVLHGTTTGEALAQLAQVGETVDVARLYLGDNLPEPTRLPADVCAFEVERRQYCCAQTRWEQASETLVSRLKRWHAEQPQAEGITVQRLLRDMPGHLDGILLRGALADLVTRGVLRLHGGRISSPNHVVQVDAGELDRRPRILEAIRQAGYLIPVLGEVARATGIPQEAVEKTVVGMTRSGELCRVSQRRYATPVQLGEFAQALLELQRSGESLSVAALKKRWGCGRNLTIEVLEYFDSIRLTQRRGELRVVIDAEQVNRFGANREVG